jgi:anti-sigma B factor antagonist
VTDGDFGLCAFWPETSCLGPAMLVRHEPGYVLVTVTGEIDYASVAELRERLFALADAGGHLVVDLNRVRFIDAAGLGALAGAARRATARGASLRVVCTRPHIRRLFRITGLDQAVLLADSLADALQEAAGAAGADETTGATGTTGATIAAAI